MKIRKLGPFEVGAVGLGCMGMSEFYGPGDDAQSLAVLERALELGVTLFDTADMYGMGRNEELLARFFLEGKGRRDRIVLATKFGVRRGAGRYERGIDNSPAYIRKACEASLKRLGVDHIDLYYIHRIEPGRPIEEAIGTLAQLVQEGKIRAVGLSETSATTLARAHKVHPIAAVQSEYSLWTRDPETDGVLDTCQRLGIGFVPYSPLGRGFLTGVITEATQFEEGDFRSSLARFSGPHAAMNHERLKIIEAIAATKHCTMAQVALAWVLANPKEIVPIPGTKRIKYLEENVAAESIELTSSELAMLDKSFPTGTDYGPRYSAEGMKGIGE